MPDGCQRAADSDAAHGSHSDAGTDAPRADAPRADAPRADAPRADVPRADVPRADVPRADAPRADAPRADVLRADCERCFGLCCAAPAFAASADFAIDKQAGQACPNLQADFRCAIHDRLRSRGFRGCAVYDCFGAGQKVTQVTFGGQDWQRAPGAAAPMFAAFMIMRQLHELLWYLNEALALQSASPIHVELRIAFDQTERLTHGSPDALAELDVSAHRGVINTLLRQASDLARADYTRGGHARGVNAGTGHAGTGHAGTGHARTDHARGVLAGTNLAGTNLAGTNLAGTNLAGTNLAGADLIGQDLRGADLTGASLRGAYLIGANLKDADLTAADLTGTDLRGADLSGANLAGSIFLTQSQLDAASGDYRTEVPTARTRPAHWAGPAAGATGR